MIVMVDEVTDGLFERSGQVIVFQQDAVLQGLMPTLDLALGLGKRQRINTYLSHSQYPG